MNTPIVDFVKKYAESNLLRLHMPGHKGNGSLGFEKFDITEIDGADVLYSADGIIAQSQHNAATLFGTKSTLYSTEGSSLCIRAMLYLIKKYALQNGQKPLVAAGRNAHKTFVTACALLDISVDWLLPDSTKTVISCDITEEFIDKYLSNTQQKPTAVYVTTPDYLGNITDIAAISKVCKKHGVLLLVDNAHGAYLKFLPNDIHPTTLGADMCCDSAHKTLPVLTGGAYLHISKCAPDFFAKNTQQALSLFASTSPSYLILQSLDAANRYIANGYRGELSEFIGKVDKLKLNLSEKGYTLCGSEALKIAILTKPYGYTGHQMADVLLQRNIVCEFYDADHIVFMLSPETGDDIYRLEEVLLEIKKQDAIPTAQPFASLKSKGLSLNEALYALKEKLPIELCLGKTSASFDVSCPPAIPIILPGEIIDEVTIECFKYYDIKQWEVIK